MNNNENTTIKDIAKKANVSVATAGRVMGNYGRTSESTKTKVLQAAKELNYVPNALAQGMRGQRTKTMAVVVPDIHNNYFSGVVATMEKKARDNGYSLIICNTNETKELEEQCLTMLASKKVDGIIISSTYINKEEIPKHILKTVFRKIPMVFFDRRIDGMPSVSILSNNEEISYQATEYLLRLGHKSVATIGSERNGSVSNTVYERENGYKRALKDFGYADNSYSIRVDYNKQDELNEKINYLLDVQKPSAIIILNNSLCGAFLKIMNERKLEFPKDYSLITWDDEEYDQILNITSIQQPLQEIGEIAVNTLFDIMNKNDNRDFVITLSSRMIMRESCSALGTNGVDCQVTLNC